MRFTTHVLRYAAGLRISKTCKKLELDHNDKAFLKNNIKWKDKEWERNKETQE